MSFYDHQIHHGETFRERIGDPEEFDAALGKVVESFSFLEQSLCNLIALFLGVRNDLGEIVTAELSFKGLINMVSSLFKYKNDRGDFVVEGEDCAARFKELMSLCFVAEQRRNEIIHSSYVSRRFRVKKTAKAKSGLKTTVEPIDSSKLLDISDFIGTVGMHVQELPLPLNMATRIVGGASVTQYYNGDELVAVFGNHYPDET